MDFLLSDDQKAVRDTAREFAKKEIAPRAAAMDRAEAFDPAVWKAASDLGYLGLGIPEEYGGTFRDNVTTALAWMEFAGACAGTATSMGASTGLFGSNVAANGTEEQKKKYLPGVASGKIIGCMGLTEPGAGSDAFSIKTRAEKRGGRYILNGSKTFISNAPIADVSLIYAVTDQAAGNRGLSAFIVEKNFPGYSAGKKFEKMGLRASPTGEIFLDDCEVPEENLVGLTPGRGFRQMIYGLNAERIGWSAIAVGLANAAFEAAFEYAGKREQFGAPIITFQMLQDMLARMAMDVYMGEQSCLLAAKAADLNEPISLAASYCKLFCGEMVMRVTTDAVQVHGGYGYMRDFPVERYMRDAKVFAIGAGTSEIQKLIIMHQLQSGAHGL
jgi:isovaleryl-CoA dehydrogenase